MPVGVIGRRRSYSLSPRPWRAGRLGRSAACGAVPPSDRSSRLLVSRTSPAGPRQASVHRQAIRNAGSATWSSLGARGGRRDRAIQSGDSNLPAANRDPRWSGRPGRSGPGQLRDEVVVLHHHLFVTQSPASGIGLRHSPNTRNVRESEGADPHFLGRNGAGGSGEPGEQGFQPVVADVHAVLHARVDVAVTPFLRRVLQVAAERGLARRSRTRSRWPRTTPRACCRRTRC